MTNDRTTAGKNIFSLKPYLKLLSSQPWLWNDMFLPWHEMINQLAEPGIKICAGCRRCGYNFTSLDIILGFQPNCSLVRCPNCRTPNTAFLSTGKLELILFSPAETLFHTAQIPEPEIWANSNFNEKTIAFRHANRLYFGGVYQAFSLLKVENPPVPAPRPPKNWRQIVRRYSPNLFPRKWLQQAINLTDEELARL